MGALHLKKILQGGGILLFFVLFSSFVIPGDYLKKHIFLPSAQVNIQRSNGEIASLVDFELPNISFYCNLSPLTYDLIPFHSLSAKQKKVIVKYKNAREAVCVIKGRTIFINKSSILNAVGYGISDKFYISMPDTINSIKGNHHEFFYFVSSIRDSNIWYIGFLFGNGKEYKLHAFVSNSFDYDYVNFNPNSDHLQLLLGKGVHQNDSTVFTKYDITPDGYIKKMAFDSTILEGSTQNYSLKTGAGEEGGTTYDPKTGNVVFSFSNTANFVHETTHGGQFEIGDFAFDNKTGMPYGQDVHDEVASYKAQYSYDPSSVSGLTSSSKANSFGSITTGWVQGITKSDGDRLYAPGGSANTGITPVNVNTNRDGLIAAYPHQAAALQTLPADFTLKSIP
jgi:hypothetical protein